MNRHLITAMLGLGTLIGAADDGGFVSLFDGKTLGGWHAVPKDSASDWSVQDGAIVGLGSANRLVYLVWKELALTDFELQLCYRLPGKGNTGVEIRSQPDRTGKRPFEGYHADLGHIGIGPHILGAWDFHFARRKEYPCNRGTSLVIAEDGTPHATSIKGALTPADLRDKQWNDVRITARGNHFQFFINDKLASEFTDRAKRGRLDHGAIGLQIHDKGMRVEFKDIRLKRLPAAGDSALQRTRYLLLDSRVVENTKNAALTVGTVRKHKANPLFEEDKPWEQRFDNLYANVLCDAADGLYKVWYCPFIYDTSSKGMSLEQRRTKTYRVPRREDAVCYATSRDGLTWEKPELGLVEYEGSTANNLVVRRAHGAGVFKDLHDADPKQRFKMFHARDILRHSADGLRWGKPASCRGIGSNGDTHNNMLWVPELNRYVAYVRLRDGGQRLVGRSESADCKRWTKAVEVLRNNRRDQAYSMPVFRYADVYLGLVAIFRTREDRVHTELAWSPDSVTWHRIQPGTPLIGNAPNEGDYDWGCVYAADDPVVLDDEIRLYYGGSNGKHTSWRDGFFCLATLRPDGWAGYGQAKPGKPAVVVTHEIPYDGQSVRVTADVEKGGIVTASIVDQNGKSLRAAKPVTATVTDGELKWSEQPDADRIRLRFEVNNAKLYSFSFGSKR